MQNKNPKKKEKPAKKEGKEQYQAPKGMHDILPKDQPRWNRVVSVGEELAELYDFYRITTPVLERAEVFERPLGEGSDVVRKEMYVLKTKGGDRLALRPEGTAPIMRAYIQHHLGYWAMPLRVYYYAPMFRHETPQAGRYRQHHQFGFEIIGDDDPVYDAQVILILNRFLNALKIPNIRLQINTIGCRVCRPNYRRKLQDYYKKYREKLCKECPVRLEDNPLRLFDCKQDGCQQLKEKAPSLLDNLCQNCNNHFRAVLEFLESAELVYELNPYLVRGYDYYSRTVFEFFGADSANALAAGGRYDYLAELLGGNSVPGVGGGLGVERIIEIMKEKNLFSEKAKSKVFFIAMGDEAKKTGLAVAEKLRRAGIRVAESLGKNSLKSQLSSADRAKAKLALIFGQKEAYEGSIIIRDMTSGAQETVALAKLVEEVKKRMR